MRLSWAKPKLDSAELYKLLHRHKLIPVGIEQVALLKNIQEIADTATFLLVIGDEEVDPPVLATILTRKLEPGILGLTFIPEVYELNATRRNQLIDLGAELRELWFKGSTRRIEAKVPVVRTQTRNSLKAMGFKEETGKHGIRLAVDYGRGPEGIAVLGLIQSDYPKPKLPEMEVTSV
jgi:hypothetical protein